jgi:hypothetical protein
MPILDAVLLVVLVIGAPISWLYLKERTKNIAREASEKALSDYKLDQEKVLQDYKHDRDKVLEAVRAAEQRRGTEFGLFARERHRAYAKVYRRYRLAADSYSKILSIYEVPDYAKWQRSDLARYLKGQNVSAALVQPIEEAIDRGDSQRVRDLMSSLEEKVRIRDAMHAFNLAKNAESLEELYLSDAVRDQLTVVRHNIAVFSVSVGRGTGNADDKAFEKKTAMENSILDLYVYMRNELRS